MAWSPWAEIGRYPEVAVYHVPAPAPGLYFPDRGVIVIAAGSTRAQRRSALAEELAHHVLGHRPDLSALEVARQELRARRWAARRLLPLAALERAFGTEPDLGDLAGVAETLGVDEATLRFRLGDLEERERHRLADARRPAA